MDRCVAVHGVGPQEPRRIECVLREKLLEAGIDLPIREFNWAAWKPRAIDGGLLAREALIDFVQTLNNAAFIERRVGGTGAEGYVSLLAEAGRTLVYLTLLVQPIAWAVIAAGLSLFGDGQPGFLHLASTFWHVSRTALLPAVALSIYSVFVGLWSDSEHRITQLMAAGLRRVVFSHLAPAIALVCLPLLMPWRTLARKATMFVPALGGAMVLMAGGAWLTDHLLARPGQEVTTFGDVATMAITVGALVVSVVAGAWAFVALAERIAPFPIEVSLDVLRYVGDHRYRLKLLEDLGATLNMVGLPPATREGSGLPAAPIGSSGKDVLDGNRSRLYLLGHSLGSVIIVDYLLHRDDHLPDRGVILVTGGSPIWQFFQTFFPGQFFPSDPLALAARLARRVRPFIWVNVYRPWDPIGRALGLNGLDFATDINTEENIPWPLAHLDYWSDGTILAKVQVAIAKRPPATASGPGSPADPEPTAPDSVAEETPRVPGRDYVNPLAYFVILPFAGLAALLIAAFPLVFATSLAYNDYRDYRTARSELSLLNQSGVVTTGVVVHQRYIIGSLAGYPGANTYSYHDRYEFTFHTASGKLVHVRHFVQDDYNYFLNKRNYIDFTALRDKIREEGQYLDPGRPLQLDMTRPKSLSGIRIRYLPVQPEVFDLPAFPSRRTWSRLWNNVTIAVEMPFVLIFLTVVLWALFSLTLVAPLLVFAYVTAMAPASAILFRVFNECLNRIFDVTDKSPE